jgi:CHAD domain-containing protein
MDPYTVMNRRMAFRLDASQPVPVAVREVADQQLRKAIAGLSGEAGLGVDEAAHDTRKRCKKLRALLRLVRPDLGRSAYRKENATLRDAARRLSGVRDAAVLMGTLDRIVEQAGEEVSSDSVAGLRAVVAKEHRDRHAELTDGDAAADAVAELDRVAARVSRWPLHDRGWDSLGGGIKAVFKRGRKEMAAAYREGTTERFHEWRKQVKYLRYQLGLLREAWPGVLDAMEATAEQLGDLLGEDHDLAVLRERVLAEPVTGDATEQTLLRLIDRRRQELQDRARPLGERLYADKPSDFADRLGRLWKVAA